MGYVMELTAEELWAFLPWGYLLTVLIEIPILLFGLSSSHRPAKRLIAGFWLTACTYPIVVWCFHSRSVLGGAKWPILRPPRYSRGRGMPAVSCSVPDPGGPRRGSTGLGGDRGCKCRLVPDWTLGVRLNRAQGILSHVGGSWCKAIAKSLCLPGLP